MHLCEHDGYHMCGGCCWQQHGGGGVMTAGVWGWWWGGEGKQRGVWHHDPAPAGGLGCLAVDWGTAGYKVHALSCVACIGHCYFGRGGRTRKGAGHGCFRLYASRTFMCVLHSDAKNSTPYVLLF